MGKAVLKAKIWGKSKKQLMNNFVALPSWHSPGSPRQALWHPRKKTRCQWHRPVCSQGFVPRYIVVKMLGVYRTSAARGSMAYDQF